MKRAKGLKGKKIRAGWTAEVLFRLPRGMDKSGPFGPLRFDAKTAKGSKGTKRSEAIAKCGMKARIVDCKSRIPKFTFANCKLRIELDRGARGERGGIQGKLGQGSCGEQ